jgi:hypothetical protein
MPRSTHDDQEWTISQSTFDTINEFEGAQDPLDIVAALAASLDGALNDIGSMDLPEGDAERLQAALDSLMSLLKVDRIIVADWIEECPECGHREESDGYGGNDCPECNEAMKVIRV